MEQNYSKFGNEELSLQARVNDAAARGELGYRLYQDLFSAKRDDLNWDIFYSLLEIPSERETGYWLSAKVASLLLGPAISIQFYKNQNARINERVEEDFLSEVIMEIARVIPNYNREKSEFPNFIKLYIKQCGYVHNKDYSVYLQKKKNIRVFSQNSLSGDGKEENQSSKDGYSRVASTVTIEDELEKKENNRKSAIFNHIVVRKAFSSEEDKRIHSKVEYLLNRKDESRLLRITDKDNKSEDNIEKIKEIELELDDEKNKKDMEDDLQKTIINACIWSKFLGGVESYDNMFIDKVVEAVENKYESKEV